MRNAKASCDGLLKRWKTFNENVARRVDELNESASTSKDREAVIRKIDAVASTITNGFGPIRDDAKKLHMLPLFVRLENADIRKYSERINDLKKRIRK